MPGLEVGRVAEVLVTVAVGPGRRGSGYLVAPGTVLTAAHVVAGAARVRVRFQAHRPEERVVTAEVAFAHAGADVAVLALSDRSDEVVGARYGRVGEHDAVLRCSAMGFPAFKLRDGQDGRPYRDSEHVHGTCSVLSNRKEGTLDLRVPPPDGSWDGMSGAAVFSGDRIVGVVAAHHFDDGPGRLAVSRADRWARRIPDSELSRLEGLLGGSLAPERLPDVVAPSGLGRIKAGYEALLQDIAPVQLVGRRDELRELMEFCAGPEPYHWIQGRPWAGKTALVSSFALHPPRGVVPVSFFITSRLAGQADSTAYTEALVHQLAALVGREPSAHASPAIRDGERRALLAEAAERVAEDGGTLLLVVDGLDEDHSARNPGALGPSIASLLPDRLPTGVRVLVTSRPNPDLPLDVKHGHPLRRCAVKTLSSTEAVTDLEHEAKFELSRALEGDDLEKEIVGLLAAARGSLRTEDLRELSGRKVYEVRQRVNGVFGRILRVRGDSAREFDDRGYLFAHETLFAAAVELLGPDVGPYRERLHGWAKEYRELGWPEETPPYLLRQYGRMVLGHGDLERAVDLAADVRRHDRMSEVTGSDAAGLAELDAVRSSVRRRAPDDLGCLAALAAAEGLMVRRNIALPSNVPRVMARLGRLGRAEGLARSIPDPYHRAVALAGVARAMADDDDPRAIDLARDAERLARQLGADTAEKGSEHFARRVVKDAAVAAAAAGAGEWALARAESLQQVYSRRKYEAIMGRECEAGSYGTEAEDDVHVMTDDAAVTMAEVSVALRRHDAGFATDILNRAERAADEFTVGGRIRILSAAVRACSRTDPPRASRLLDRIEQELADHMIGKAAILSTAATALHDICPERATQWAREAIQYARRALGGPPVMTAYKSVEATVCALVDVGLVSDAHALADLCQFRQDIRAPFYETVAVGWARAGQFERARQILEENCAPVAVSPWLLVRLVEALASAGHFDEAERCAPRIGHPAWLAEALGCLAEQALDHDPPRAARLLEAALEAAARPIADDRVGNLETLTGALASCGEFDSAERLARMITRPDRRAQALAAVVVPLSHSDPGRAARLAEEAGDCAEAETDQRLRDKALMMAGEVLGHVGHGSRARSLVYAIRGGTAERHQAGAALASRLEKRERASAVELVGSAGQWPATHTPGSRERTLALLITAVRDWDRERAQLLVNEMRRRTLTPHEDEPPGPAKTLVLAALTLIDAHPADAERLLSSVDARLRDLERAAGQPDAEERGARALVHAALGEYEKAEESAARIRPQRERPHSRAALAALLVGVEKESTIAQRELVSPDLAIYLHVCAALPVPRGEARGERLACARRLLAEVLASDGWHYALPVLAELDPNAVRRVRNIVFAQLDLDLDADVNTAPPPRPTPA
ncbi:trypsin-like peptidase domain-containing protein [Streptomyces sp. LZ34]